MFTATESAGALSDDERGHKNVIFTTSTLPLPTSAIAKEVAKTSENEQLGRAAHLYAFLLRTDRTLRDLNEGAEIYALLLHIPRTTKVKLVYGPGIGTNAGVLLGSSLSRKVLGLIGDGGGPKVPSPLVLPAEALEIVTVSTMTHKQFSTAITQKGPNYSGALLPNAQVTTESEIFKLAPIPFYLVYDGVENFLDAAEVYERVLGVATEDEVEVPMLQHLRHFLRACLQTHPASAPSPSLDAEDLYITTTREAKQWAKQKFQKLFPNLQPPTFESLRDTLVQLISAELPTATVNTQATSATAVASLTDDTPDIFESGRDMHG